MSKKNIERNTPCPCGSGEKYKNCHLKFNKKVQEYPNNDYLNNNLIMINKYQTLYSNGLDIDDVIEKIGKNYFGELNITDLVRFRVFLDSAILLFNREKLEKDYFKKNFIYADFFNHLNNSEKDKILLDLYKKYFNLYKDELMINEGTVQSFDKFYVSSNRESKSPYDQLAILRNALAHMNYGNFITLENGYFLGYFIYNNKNGKAINHGFILEPILHRFIQSYFSNYTSYGVVYKHSWFNFNSTNKISSEQVIDFKKQSFISRIVRKLLNKKNKTFAFFNILTYDGKGDEKLKYAGDNQHAMNIFTQKLNNLNFIELENFIKNNREIYNHVVTEIPENRIEVEVSFLTTYLNKKEITYKEFSSEIKFLYDFETEFSNFLVHLMQLNDRLIDYWCNIFYIEDVSPEKTQNQIKEINKSIRELKEDEDKIVGFNFMFPVLRLLDISLRLEDDDLKKISPLSVNIDGFTYEEDNLQKYYQNNSSTINKRSETKYYYILERIRNAIAHGHITTYLDSNSNIVYKLEDIWNNRTEKVEIDYDSMINFLEQPIFTER